MAVQAAEGEPVDAFRHHCFRNDLLVANLGLARDVVLAYFFGASANADAFFLAFKIPTFSKNVCRGALPSVRSCPC